MLWDAVTKKRVDGQVDYARVLSGRESCAFCAMLASRGPVYSEDTVVRRRDGRRYHDNCDCIAVSVVEGQPWFGEAEYKRLEAQWQEHVNSGGVDIRDYSPFTAKGGKERGTSPLKLPGASRKGSKRTPKSAASGANPTGDLENCVRCVHAWALRMHGYDVTAIPGQPNETAQESTRYWVDSDGQSPQQIDNEVESALNAASTGSIRWVDLTGFSPTASAVLLVQGKKL